MKLPALIALSLLAGCTLFHGDNGDRQMVSDGGNVGKGCDITYGSSVQLIDPYSLTCRSYNTDPYCDPSSCDECPAFYDGGATIYPPWGSCQSDCLGRDEASCGLTLGCRVTKEANHYFGFSSGDPYLGCYPVNGQPIVDGPDCRELDANTCSSLERCWAIYDAPNGLQCPINRREACPSGSFVACVDAGTGVPGVCEGLTPITCAAPRPTCPTGSSPGVDSGCYTGACIPSRYCVFPD